MLTAYHWFGMMQAHRTKYLKWALTRFKEMRHNIEIFYHRVSTKTNTNQYNEPNAGSIIYGIVQIVEATNLTPQNNWYFKQDIDMIERWNYILKQIL